MFAVVAIKFLVSEVCRCFRFLPLAAHDLNETGDPDFGSVSQPPHPSLTCIASIGTLRHSLQGAIVMRTRTLCPSFLQIQLHKLSIRHIHWCTFTWRPSVSHREKKKRIHQMFCSHVFPVVHMMTNRWQRHSTFSWWLDLSVVLNVNLLDLLFQSWSKRDEGWERRVFGLCKQRGEKNELEKKKK